MEGPNLSRAGVVGFDSQWYERHLAHRDTSQAPAWRISFAAIPPDDRAAIQVLLGSRAGAPGLIESKAVFHSRGCRGCHKVGGVGGDDGPDLTRIGEMDPGQRNFTNVPEPHTVARWLAEHFRRPAAIVPGSNMPELGLPEKDIEALTFYMLSLRRSDLPETYWPSDRVRAERFGAREFSSDGATLYGTFCAACHGQRGEGMRYPGMVAFPAIGNPDFLGLVSNAFVTATVQHGRQGRRMPAWGESTGGLRPAEIDSVVAYVRSLVGGVGSEPDPRPVRWVRADAALGRTLYASNCASCHGANGQGGEGTALADAVLLGNATDTYFVETIRRGRRGTSMQGFTSGSTTRRTLSQPEIEAIVTHIRTWEAHP
jgi:mono/diheme cytochrome c family protein